MSLNDYLEKERVRKQNCPWCHPDENGLFSAARFEDESGSVVSLFFSGAQATIVLRKHNELLANLSQEIYNCPMCGRQLRTYPEETATEDKVQ